MGQMATVQKKFSEHIIRMAKGIYLEGDVESTKGEDVAFLLKALRVLSKQRDCAEAESRLAAWAEQHNGKIAERAHRGLRKL